MDVEDFSSWLCANMDLTNSRADEMVFKVVRIGPVPVTGMHSLDVLHCPSGAVLRVYVESIRRPV